MLILIWERFFLFLLVLKLTVSPSNCVLLSQVSGASGGLELTFAFLNVCEMEGILHKPTIPLVEPSKFQMEIHLIFGGWLDVPLVKSHNLTDTETYIVHFTQAIELAVVRREGGVPE